MSPNGVPSSVARGCRRCDAFGRPGLLAFALFVLAAVRMASAADICSSVYYTYSAKGFNTKSIPREPVSGEHLRICQQGKTTCCTEEMEHNFETQSRQEFDRLLKDAIEDLRAVFATRTQKFDEFFNELLKKSKKDFHEMFLKTYGMLYENNSYVFTKLFESLEKYYSTGNVNLVEVMDSFFLTLYQKMFTVLNGQFTFDQNYLNCVTDYMEELQPFGDVPHKLSLQVKRAFVAARAFIWGLVIGREVVKNMLEVPSAPECTKALMKMTYCPQCQGFQNLKPCSNYCSNVMKGCLSYHADLDKDWNNYIEALLMLADRLEGPFNIESVVDPIDIKISDAIMNFQENGQQVSQKIFEGCGKLKITKRDVSQELKLETLKFGRQPSAPRPTTAAGTSLDRLVRDIKTKIKSYRTFWRDLPDNLCAKINPITTDPKNSDCWNGLSKDRPESSKNGSHHADLVKDASKQNTIVNEQIVKIKTVTEQLKEAYHGKDVKFVDEELIGSGSGSGSGDGFDDSSASVSVPEEPEESDFAFTSTTMMPDIRKPHKGGAPPKVKDVDVPPSSSTTPAPPQHVKMTLNRAISIVVLPVLLTWLGSMF